MAKCKGCGAPIVFIGTPEGRSIPCDAEQVLYWARPRATGKVVTPNGIVVSCDLQGDPKLATGIGYKPHWASCPKAGQFRRTRT